MFWGRYIDCSGTEPKINIFDQIFFLTLSVRPLLSFDMLLALVSDIGGSNSPRYYNTANNNTQQHAIHKQAVQQRAVQQHGICIKRRIQEKGYRKKGYRLKMITIGISEERPKELN